MLVILKILSLVFGKELSCIMNVSECIVCGCIL